MLTYAHVCSRMLTYAHLCLRMLTYAHVCSRMLTSELRSVCLVQAHEGGVCGFSGKPDRGGIVVGTRTNELYALSGTAQVLLCVCGAWVCGWG
jgi:hypothetical protein